jgi:hypothetical protein
MGGYGAEDDKNGGVMINSAVSRQFIGLYRLIKEFDLRLPLPVVQSIVAPSTRRTIISDREVLEQYPKSYLPDGITGHLKFAMRHEPLDLRVLSAVFAAMDVRELERWIREEPTGVFARRAWYLYELLTGRTLDVPDLIPSGYIDLLDPKLHVTGPRQLVRRQRVNDNLLGNRDYCPLVRLTPTIDSFIRKDLSSGTRAIIEGCDPAVLARAVHYLFTKETKSSFAIEGETPGADRTQRFVAALMEASSFDATSKDAYVRLQQSIVDSRYAQLDWRTTQNYVSQTLSDYSEDVQFACPKDADVPGLMSAWMEMTRKLENPGATDPVVAAAATAFGFVFIHPFDDGNGRIHRFIVHHVLGRHGFTPPGILFPISAVMLRNRAEYDRTLERFSSSIMPFVDYELDANGRMRIKNDTVWLYRYFDATPQAEYLYECIEETIRRDLRDEIAFLTVFDKAVRGVMEIVDMPNRRASLLARLILQNRGKLSSAKRPMFSEITEEEIERIEEAVRWAGEGMQT